MSDMNESLLNRLDRRTVLRAGALLTGGIGAAALIGCGDDNEEEPAPAASYPAWLHTLWNRIWRFIETH